MRNRGSDTMYVDFFTNLAVAWFTAGIILPGLSLKFEIIQVQGVLIALVATFMCLRIANQIARKVHV